MRLTLRTLLAYRDGVLDPKDSQVLESKLRESSTARHISQRIDQSLRNPKLAPIPIDAKEPGFDANQIAEYLDDTIPTEEIPELERKCLENNALLSEVGSCHSILAKALTQAVEIPDQLRARIHALPNQPNASPSRLRIERVDVGPNRLRIDPGVGGGSDVFPINASSETLGSVVSGQAQASRTERISTATVRPTTADARASGIELSEGLGNQVPEYLLGSDRSWLKNAIAVAALCLGLAIVGVLALGPADRLAQMLQTHSPPNRASDNSEKSEQDRLSPIPENGSDEQEQTVAPNPAGGANGETLDKDAGSSETNQVEGEQKDAPNLGESTKADPAMSAVDSTPNRSEESGESGATPVSEASKEADISSDPKPAIASAGDSKVEENAIQWLPESEESSSALVFLREVSEQDPQWKLASGGMKSAGGSWIIPTAQRPVFRLGGGGRAIVCGETELTAAFSVDPSVANPIAARIPYGRLILFPSPDQTTFQFLTNAGVLKIEFTDKDSSCAIDVRSHWGDWTPPASVSREVPNAFISTLADSIQTTSVIELIGLQGSLKASLHAGGVEAERGAKLVEVGDRIQIRGAGDPLNIPLEKTPEWLRSSVERPIDQYASRDIAKALASKDVSATETLRQLLNHRRGETASMAARLLAQQGDFSMLAGTAGLLNRKGVFVHSAAWLNKMASFVHSKDRIFAFVAGFVQGDPERAETLLRLMIPYSNAQLAEGGDRFLVEALSSGLLDERTLAIVQLSELTGRTLSYHPEKNSADSMQQWRKLLSKSEIRRSEPSVVP
ncbi:hypothetical protein SH501x_000090 [Pirellulaceae bacterium SH501]